MNAYDDDDDDDDDVIASEKWISDDQPSKTRIRQLWVFLESNAGKLS